MRVLVCGGRNFSDTNSLVTTLDTWHKQHGPITCIVHGMARGADQFADDWARKCGVQVARYPAEWHAKGAAAGPIRNSRMLKEGKPDVVIAFPGGRGTEDMVEKAKRAGVRVVKVKADPRREVK